MKRMKSQAFSALGENNCNPLHTTIWMNLKYNIEQMKPDTKECIV